MNNLDSYIRELITRYFLGELDEVGCEELWIWVKADKVHEHLFKKWIRELYRLQVTGKWDSVYVGEAKKRVYRKLNRSRNTWRIGTAAAIGILLISSAFLYLYKGGDDEFVEERIFTELIQQQGSHQAILSIGEGKKVVLNDSDKKTIHVDSSSRVFMDDSCVVRYERIEREVSREVEIHTLEVPRGSEFKVVLSDGTRIWINAQTKLSYPEFFDGEKREVFLVGEAYFEVTHNAEMPFVVTTADMGITVLGTSFNVKAYPEDENVITTLEAGKIRQKYTKTGEEVVLSPSDQAVYLKSSGQLSTKQVDVREAIGWKDGRVILKNKSLKEIFSELGRWYDFEVEYEDKELANTRFYVNMNRYDDIKIVLEKLQKTNGIKFMFCGRKIVVYDNAIIK